MFFVYFDSEKIVLNGADITQCICAVGLGIYGDSNSESEEEQSEHVQIQNDDSDEELIVNIFEIDYYEYTFIILFYELIL